MEPSSELEPPTARSPHSKPDTRNGEVGLEGFKANPALRILSDAMKHVPAEMAFDRHRSTLLLRCTWNRARNAIRRRFRSLC
jgi:hypothetical protein